MKFRGRETTHIEKEDRMKKNYKDLSMMLTSQKLD